MTFGSLLSSDKSPLFVAIALTIFGWYVDSISRYFTDQTIIYVSPKKSTANDEYLIKNVSLNKDAENIFIQVQCIPASNCLAQLAGGGSRFGTLEQVAPFAASGNQSCLQTEASYQAQVSLPPGASVRINVSKKPEGKTELYMVGRLERQCDTSNVAPLQIRVEQYPSAIAFLLENFVAYYFISIVVLILVFVITIWRVMFASSQDSGEGTEHATQALTIDLTIRRDRQYRSDQSG